MISKFIATISAILLFASFGQGDTNKSASDSLTEEDNGDDRADRKQIVDFRFQKQTRRFN
ncbi:MAG: hypothetical protein ABI760_16710 [Ferruginibacter sp.]